MKVLVFCLILLTSYVVSQQYLCIPDAATGFYYDSITTTWKPTTFSVGDTKYILSNCDASLANCTYQLNEFGESFPIAFCEYEFNEAGNLFCEGLNDFTMNLKNYRFMLTSTFGYVSVNPDNEFSKTDEESDTPFMMIGRCSGF